MSMHRAQCITVCIDMAAEHDGLRVIDKGVQLAALPFCHDLFQH